MAVWSRNPNLMRQGKFDRLDERYGHRAIYVPSHACPHSRCGEGRPAAPGVVAECNFCHLPSNNFNVIFDEPGQVEAEYEVPNLGGEGLSLDHRWLLSPPTIEARGVTYRYLEDFAVRERAVEWLCAPPPYPTYSRPWVVRYRAFEEDEIYIMHANLQAAGGRSKAEEGKLFSPAWLEQGGIAASIPPQAKSYNANSGDLLIPVDATLPVNQQLKLNLVETRSYHRFIVSIDKAFYQRKVSRAKDEWANIDVTDQVSYDFVSQLWQIPQSVKDEADILSVSYRACPIYAVNRDTGEWRTPSFATQPRLFTLDRQEVVF